MRKSVLRQSCCVSHVASICGVLYYGAERVASIILCLFVFPSSLCLATGESCCSNHIASICFSLYHFVFFNVTLFNSLRVKFLLKPDCAYFCLIFACQGDAFPFTHFDIQMRVCARNVCIFVREVCVHVHTCTIATNLVMSKCM